MSALMYYRPDDHISYLVECLQKLRSQGIISVKWNQFIDARRTSKSPLPPILPYTPSAERFGLRSRQLLCRIEFV